MTVRIEEHAPGVRLLTMDRQERRNALDPKTYRELTNAIRESDDDDAVRVSVLTGAGGVFTSGNDIGSFQDTAGRDGGEAKDLLIALVTARNRLSQRSRGLQSESAPRCCCTATWHSRGEVHDSDCRSFRSGSRPRADRVTCCRRSRDSSGQRNY